jgi:hypothetical protein
MITISTPRQDSFSIPQVTTDPTSPETESAWVLKSGGGVSVTGGGQLNAIIGLAFPYISAGASSSGGAATYQLSYRTLDGTTKRVTLS